MTPAERANLSETARGRAFDRYLASLLAPRPARDGLLALAAFTAELDIIAERVSEPMLGEIRLQWWRDQLAALFSAGPEEAEGAADHPVLAALAPMVTSGALAQGRLAGMIDARSFDLAGGAMPDERAITAYARKTEGAHGVLAATWIATHSGDREPLSGKAIDAAEATGTAYGFARTVALAGRYRALGADVVASAEPDPSVSEQSGAVAPVGAQVPSLRFVLAELDLLLDKARKAVREANTEHPSSRAALRTAMLPCALVAKYRDAITDLGADGLMQRPAEIGPMSRVVALWRARLTGRV